MECTTEPSGEYGGGSSEVELAVKLVLLVLLVGEIGTLSMCVGLLETGSAPSGMVGGWGVVSRELLLVCRPFFPVDL